MGIACVYIIVRNQALLQGMQWHRVWSRATGIEFRLVGLSDRAFLGFGDGVHLGEPQQHPDISPA